MRDFAECKPFLDHIALEHRHLHQAINEIDECLRSAAPGRAEIARQRLSELRSQLSQHFIEEENGGCLEEAACRCPNLSPQLTELQREHPALLAAADDALHQFDLGGSTISNAAAEAFGRLARKLQMHEALENRLLRLAFGANQDCEEE